ncbi:G-protein coupled receptor daf-37-like [Folsomia candida]|uniref:FMRFamide receptor n=1 Tax=Folsomia candida TaxID=158441 RepID=A0A226EBZ5_FOLCA|nr:G-protein coupled receptor daf-37-like [Folsomia candida]OXA54547.1 FMRFamide receptor [Folsomia candida]
MATRPEVLNEQFFDNSTSNETQVDELLQFVEPSLVEKVKSTFFFVIALVSICVGTLGISGNTLSIFVLSTNGLKNSPARRMLRWLAVWDCISIVSLLFFMDYINVIWFHATKNEKVFTYWFPLIHKFSDPLFATATMGSVSMTLLLTWERCRAVCTPLEFRQTSPKLIWGSIAGVVVLNLPGWFQLKIVPVERDGETFYNYTDSDFGRSDFYRVVNSDITHFFIRLLIPFGLLFYFNVKIVASLKSRVNRVRDMTSSSEPACLSKSVTKIVVAIVSLSLLTNALFCVYMVLDSLATTSWAGSPSHGFYAQGMFMILLNSSANFIFYCLFGRKFRTALKNLCCLKLG